MKPDIIDIVTTVLKGIEHHSQLCYFPNDSIIPTKLTYGNKNRIYPVNISPIPSVIYK